MQPITKAVSITGLILCLALISCSKSSGSSNSSSNSPVSGLVGWLKFNEGAGSTAADSSGFGNNGTLVGSPSWISGYYNGALSFGASSPQYVSFGSTVFATESAPFSVCAWVESTNSYSGYGVIMQLQSNSTNWFVLMSDQSSYKGVSVGSSSANWAMIKTGNLPSAGAWHHIAVTYNGAAPGTISNFQIYVDGVAQTLSAAGVYSDGSSGNVIGDSADNANQWVGNIEDVRIYNTALTSDQVNFIMNNPGI